MAVSFENKRVLIAGDVMLDKYIFGQVDRISPEAPVPIVSITREYSVPGGAANTAANIVALGGSALLVGVVGGDLVAETFIRESREKGINTDRVVADPKRSTNQKMRVIGQSQQLLRIDHDPDQPADESTLEKIRLHCTEAENISAYVISDYGKGGLDEKTVRSIQATCFDRNLPLIVDPKPQHKLWYKNIYLMTPNRKETEAMTGLTLNTTEQVEKAGIQLSAELNCNVLVTMGERGMSLFEKSQPPFHIPAHASEVYDVSGAGDTVVATLALAVASKIDLRRAVVLANHAAAVKVRKLGTAVVTIAELNKALLEFEK